MELATTIDPNAPLYEGANMLMAASAIANTAIGIPQGVPATRPLRGAAPRRAMGFRRAQQPQAPGLSVRVGPVVLAGRSPVGMNRRDMAPVAPESMARGATRYYRADVSRAFIMRAEQAAGRNTKSRRASALLFSSGMRNQPEAGLFGLSIPTPNAQYLDALKRRAFAMQLRDTLRARFNRNTFDLSDGHADNDNTMRAINQGYAPALVATM